MSDQFIRWSQLVRSPGEVRIEGFHASELPAEGDTSPGAPGRPALRLMVYPTAMAEPVFLVDITSTAVQAMLEGFLRTGVGVGKYLSWQSWGFGPRRRDMVRLRSSIG